jgi:hypothetical protein
LAVNIFAGKIYDGKLYVLNDNDKNEVYDFQTQKWNSWKAIPHNIGMGACMVNWKDNIIVFGGSDYQNGVQIYNIPTQVLLG